MRFVCLAVLGICAIRSVGATDSKPPPLPQLEQQQSQMQHANAASEQTQTATGGSGGNGYGTASNGSMTSRNVALVNAAPNVPVCPAGLVPGKGKHRGHNSPLYSITATCDAPDDAQKAAIEAHREHEARLATIAADAMRAEAERDRAATERINALARACKEYADRALDACVSK